MRLRDGEPIGQALRRFKKLLERNRDRRKWARPFSRRKDEPYFVPNTAIRRHKQYRKWLLIQAAMGKGPKAKKAERPQRE